MIEINNLSRSLVDKRTLKAAAEIVLRGERKKSAELSIVLTGESEIKKINKKYRKKNKATDVLSFGSDKKFISPANDLGEVVICLSVVKKNAEKFDSSFKEELARVLIHGILHLLGYEHERGGEKAEKMAEKEKYYLSKLNPVKLSRFQRDTASLLRS